MQNILVHPVCELVDNTSQSMVRDLDEAKSLSSALQQMNEAEKQATALEHMLDDLDGKMELILKQIEENNSERRETPISGTKREEK